MTKLTDEERAELRRLCEARIAGGRVVDAPDYILRLLDERDRLAALVKSQHDAALETARIADEALAENERLRRECDERLAESDAFTHMSTRALRAEAENERLRAEERHQREMRADDLRVTVASRRESDDLRAEVERLTAAGKMLHEAWARADDARLRLEEQLAAEKAALRDTAAGMCCPRCDETQERIDGVLGMLRNRAKMEHCPVCWAYHVDGSRACVSEAAATATRARRETRSQMASAEETLARVAAALDGEDGACPGASRRAARELLRAIADGVCVNALFRARCASALLGKEGT